MKVVYAQTISTLYSGTGQAISSNPVIDTMATQAVAEAKTNYERSGGIASSAKVIIIIENVDDGSSVLVNKIRSVFGQSILILGMQDPWADYTPYTLDSIPSSSSTKSLSLMALGGSAINVTYAAGVADFASNSNVEAQKGGLDLAGKLHPQAGVNNLILLFGQMHGELNQYVISGMKQIYGTPLPQNIKIVGWSGPYWGGYIYDNGTLKGNLIQGVMLSGNFRWAFRGVAHGTIGWDGISGPDGGNPVTEITKEYSQIKTELGTIPTASFMVIAHPDRSLFPEIRDSIYNTMGAIAMIGKHGGSEIGHDTTTGDVIADGSHFFLAGIAASLPGTSPQPTTTDATTKTGDANTDNKVNGADYIIWLNHYGLSSSGPSNGDFNSDSHVNGADYIIWLNNYGT